MKNNFLVKNRLEAVSWHRGLRTTKKFAALSRS